MVDIEVSTWLDHRLTATNILRYSARQRLPQIFLNTLASRFQKDLLNICSERFDDAVGNAFMQITDMVTEWPAVHMKKIYKEHYRIAKGVEGQIIDAYLMMVRNGLSRIENVLVRFDDHHPRSSVLIPKLKRRFTLSALSINPQKQEQ